VLTRTVAKQVLVCTPSNAAADLVLVRLLKFFPLLRALRANATSRFSSDMDPKLKDHTLYDEDKECYYTPADLSSYQVVVATLSSSRNVAATNFHPDYLFMDEAGHATEADALLPLAGFYKPTAPDGKAMQVVLAGDHKQLGPVVQSPYCVRHNYNVSIMERLMMQAPYAREEASEHNSHFVVKLLNNYRSHPKLIDVPNRLYYDSELVAAADPALTHLYVGWEELPNPTVPLVLHGVQGKNVREGRSPSYCNLEEIDVVRSWLIKLQDYRQVGFDGSQVGIVTPYSKQATKLREACHKMGLTKVRVGTVEAMQGDERRVVLVSTVRSHSDATLNNIKQLLTFDKVHDLGFVGQPKRVNVSLTRAKALLIVIGDPNVLKGDPNWRSLLEFSQANQCMTGVR
jgi:helicase MOV-10